MAHHYLVRSCFLCMHAHKLRWWVDQTLQIVGISLHVLCRSSCDDFFSLLDRCWNNYPLGKDIFQLVSGRMYIFYKEDKIEEMQGQITGLIKEIEPKDFSDLSVFPMGFSDLA